MLKKQRTVGIERSEIDFMVQQFSVRDSRTVANMGAHAKDTKWRIQLGMDEQIVEIHLHVDKGILGGVEVGLKCNGEQEFPKSGTKGKIKEDIFWTKPFRGTVKNLGVKNFFEVRPTTQGIERWYPATLNMQREDGKFEATVNMPGADGTTKPMEFEAVNHTDIRESQTKRPLDVPERSLTLEVPKSDPLHATLSVDTDKLITHYFARPTPPPGSTVPKAIQFKVDKHRTKIIGTVGHEALSRYMQQEAYILEMNAAKAKKTWSIQIGPYAQHTIMVEKKAHQVVLLTVDNMPLVEAGQEDLDCTSDVWECTFHFKGERKYNFEVYKTDSNGSVLDTKGFVKRSDVFSLECNVRIRDHKDLTYAELYINGILSKDLPQLPSVHNEALLHCTPEAFILTYNMPVPYKVDEEAKASVFQAVFANTEPGGSLFYQVFGCCYNPRPHAASEMSAMGEVSPVSGGGAPIGFDPASGSAPSTSIERQGR